MPATQRRRWTADEVRHLMDESPGHWPRYELIDGELLVSPSPRPPHYRALMWLFHALDPYTAREGVGETCLSPADLEFKPQTISQPDIFVGPADQVRRIKLWPELKGVILTVEVLSPGTARHDRGKKRRHYQRSRIPEYWIIDHKARFVERWRPDDIQPEILTDTLVWHPPAASTPLTLQLSELWEAAAN